MCKSAKTLSSREARANFSNLLSSVYRTKEPVIIEKYGKPVALVISMEEYQRLQDERERAWAAVERVRERNADKDPDEVLRNVTAEVEAVRHELFDSAAALRGIGRGERLVERPQEERHRDGERN